MSTEKPAAYPQNALLPELIATRGLAAVWIVVAHCIVNVTQEDVGVLAPLEYTRIIVDFFFVLSGFVLAHVYDREWRDGRFQYVRFLTRRLARLWPLHVATLVASACIVTAGRAVGVEPPTPHDLYTFTVTFFLMHAVWLTPNLAWNMASWSVGAEWIAYLAIPLFFAAADRVRGTAARVLVGLGLFVLAAALSEAVLGLDIVMLTFDGGAFRLIPSFFAGILLRRVFDDEPRLLAMTPRIYAVVVAAVLAVCVALVALRAPYATLWPPMVVLVAALALRATWTGGGWFRGRVVMWLGDLSYAIYMTHGLVIVVLFNVAELAGWGGTFNERLLISLAVLPCTLVASQLAYVLFEKPGRVLVARVAERLLPAMSRKQGAKA